MQIFVKGLTGRTLTVDVEPSLTVLKLKTELEELEAVPADSQRLVYAGKQLEDEKTLDDYGIQKEATIHMVHRLLGGAKKRKKKNYSTPKKIKHKKKKTKLAILKYYKIDENGKITRLRRECPMEQCGAGTFMAAMVDRHYCGKCGYTLVYNKDKQLTEKPPRD